MIHRRIPRSTLIALAASLSLAGQIVGQSQDYNLYGNPGLIEMPGADMADDGQLAITFGMGATARNTSVNFQALPWVAGTVRYSTIDDFNADGTAGDFRSFDLRFRLWEEDGLWPGLALGFRDVLGDGPFGAEYLVASKTVLPGVSLTGGIGWGRLGGEGGFDLGAGPRTLTDPGGRLQVGSYFQGDAAFFGGIEWQTPVEGVTLKAEYSSDDFTGEGATGYDPASPFNLGITWAPNRSFALSGYLLHGEKAGVQLTFTGNPNRPVLPQDFGTGPAPVRARAADAPTGTDWARNPANRDVLIGAIAGVLAADGILIEEARITSHSVDLFISNTLMPRTPKAIGRTARVLAAGMPPSVEIFRITLVEDGLTTTTAELRRSDIEAQVDRPGAGLASWQTTALTDAVGTLRGADVYRRPIEDKFSWGLNARVPYSLFDPDDGVRPDVLVSASAGYQLTPGFSVGGEISRFVVGSDRETVSTSTSPLPRVRSDSNLYFSGRDIALERLTAEYVFKPTPVVYGRITAGYLERMFAGVSGELLWAPTASSIAVGAEINYARQREFEAPLGLTEYDVVTGHGSIYWDTGFRGIEAQLDAGRYLAGDWGGTVTLSRRFANGWDVSGYVTRTDVSFDDFGKGSYAKGVRVTMPLRWGLPFETRSTAELDLSEFDRDGGARLRVDGRLYDRVRDTDSNTLEAQWGSFWQ